jgi:hypothetical protein
MVCTERTKTKPRAVVSLKSPPIWAARSVGRTLRKLSRVTLGRLRHGHKRREADRNPVRPLSRASECPDRSMDAGWPGGGTPVDLSALPCGERDHGPRQSRWGCDRNGDSYEGTATVIWGGRFEDFLVQEAAHVFHPTKERKTSGRPSPPSFANRYARSFG